MCPIANVKRKNLDLIDKINLNSFSNWHFYFLFAQLLVLVFLRLSTKSTWQMWLSSILARGDGDGFRGGIQDRVFTILGLINVSFSIFILAGDWSFLPFGFDGQTGYLVILFLGALWLVMYMLIFNLGHYLSLEHSIILYARDSYYQLFKVYGVVGLAFNLVLIFTPLNFIFLAEYLIIVLFLGLILRRIFIGVLQAIGNGVSMWYIILYLCALEIIPLLCLIKAAR